MKIDDLVVGNLYREKMILDGSIRYLVYLDRAIDNNGSILYVFRDKDKPQWCPVFGFHEDYLRDFLEAVDV